MQDIRPVTHHRGDSIDYVHCTADLLTDWFSFWIDNQFVQFGDTLYRQVHGIPMGTNCAVFVANLYLFTYELEFIRHLADEGEVDLMRRLINVGRYVDDLVAVDADVIHDRLYIDGTRRGIYPPGSLQLEETGSGTSVNYMDVVFSRDPRLGVATDVYDKRSEPGFRRIKMIRFPHIESHISDSAKYNILTSQFIRIHRLCTSEFAFIHRMADLLAAFCLKNYHPPFLFGKLRKMVFRHPDMYAVR